MLRRPNPFFLLIAALAVVSLPALAKPSSNATIKATIDVGESTEIGSTTLAPGQYHVVVDGNQAKFEREGKLIAEAPCTLKDMPTKARETEFMVNNNQMTEIHVAGKSQEIDFSMNHPSGN